MQGESTTADQRTKKNKTKTIEHAPCCVFPRRFVQQCWTTFAEPETNPISDKFRQPCENAANGCRELIIGNMIARHQLECAFRKFQCIGSKLNVWE